MKRKAPSTKRTFRRWRDVRAEHLSPQSRARVDAEVRRTLLDMDLREMRELAQVPQTRVAAALETTQSQISRIEGREDHLVSTLREYVRALGGELDVIARFGDRTIRLRGV